MAGAPLDQARRLALALVESLTEADRLEMIAFSGEAARWAPGPAAASSAARADGRPWLEGLEAGGGTEMSLGVREAQRPLHQDVPRQVILMTDGHIGFGRMRELGRQSRKATAGSGGNRDERSAC